MTPDEIQALREKHKACDCDNDCENCTPIVIAQTPDEIQACDHLMPDPITGLSSRASEWGHIFCPKCGIKLKEGN